MLKHTRTTQWTATTILALTGVALMGASDEHTAGDFAQITPAPIVANDVPALGPARIVQSFTYQGRLKVDGLPADGTFDMVFHIATAPVLGISLQQIAINNVPVTDGLFQVELAFDATHFGGDDRWLAVDVEGTFMHPRHHVLPTPYAMTADTLEVPATLSGSGTVFTANSESGTGVTGRHTSVGGIQAGVVGTTDSTSAGAQGMLGQVNSTSPGSSSVGVRGINNGTGGSGIGVYGSQNGSGWGVFGLAPSGRGVYGSSTSGDGVYGASSNGTGVQGTSSSGIGVYGRTSSTAASANALVGVVTSTSPGGLSAGVRGINNGTGVSGIGVHGSQAGTGWGVYGTSGGRGVYGNSGTGEGVRGNTSSGIGVVATNASADTRAELANEDYGVYGENADTDASGTGVYGLGGEVGVYGATTSTGFGTRTGVFGIADAQQSGINVTRGVYGFAFANYFDGNREAYGAFGRAASGNTTNRAYGVYGEAVGPGTNWAGYFDGSVHIVGTISKGAGRASRSTIRLIPKTNTSCIPSSNRRT